MGTKIDHPFEGGYVETSAEAYVLLREGGAVDNSDDKWNDHKNSDILFIANGCIASSDVLDFNDVVARKLIIVDNQLVWNEDTSEFPKEFIEKIAKSIEKSISESNDGGKNDFYTFAPYVKNVDSLSRYLELSGAEFNILKSLTSNLGARHVGTDSKREAKKCLHYAVERMLYTFTPEEILSQIQKQLGEN